MLYVSWGTGLSSTLVADGRCLAGHRGEALALGEWSAGGTTLERFASGRGVAERWARRTGGSETCRDVDRLAADGDATAGEIIESAAASVAAALAALVQVLDPRVVVLGGGVGSSGGSLPRRVAEWTPALLHRPAPPRVEPARAGADAGLVGAAVVAWRALEARR
jgi:glucokinase